MSWYPYTVYQKTGNEMGEELTHLKVIESRSLPKYGYQKVLEIFLQSFLVS